MLLILIPISLFINRISVKNILPAFGGEYVLSLNWTLYNNLIFVASCIMRMKHMMCL